MKKKIKGTKKKPRLSVFRSNKLVYSQIIDDDRGKTLVAVSEKELSLSKTKSMKKVEKAMLVGEMLAKKALEAKIKNVVFDRGRYLYHGRVKALAEGARKGGLRF